MVKANMVVVVKTDENLTGRNHTISAGGS